MSSTKSSLFHPVTPNRCHGSTLGQGLATLAFGAFFANPVMAVEPDEMAEQLASLRAEVAQLSADLDDENERHQARMRSLETQRADVELQLRRERTQLQNFREEQTELQAIVDERDDDEALLSALELSLDRIAESIRAGIPYRMTDRLASVDELREQISNATVSPAQGAARAWALVEDELRLTSENALDREVLDIEGEAVLVDIARLGMLTLYYRTPDGSFGRLSPNSGGWNWLPVADEASITQISALFEDLQKGVRTGSFELPLELRASQ